MDARRSRPHRPAAQGGHAEEDLAALAVFGCPYYERILAAYNEASPLEDGWRERLTLHQAHIIMIHCAVFGRSYVPDAVAIAGGTPKHEAGARSRRATQLRPRP